MPSNSGCSSRASSNRPSRSATSFSASFSLPTALPVISACSSHGTPKSTYCLGGATTGANFDSVSYSRFFMPPKTLMIRSGLSLITSSGLRSVRGITLGLVFIAAISSLAHGTLVTGPTPTQSRMAIGSTPIASRNSWSL